MGDHHRSERGSTAREVHERPDRVKSGLKTLKFKHKGEKPWQNS
jgi:hypothetical protein